MGVDKPCENCGSVTFAGHEIQGVYDGVLFWTCECCGLARVRDFGEWERRNQQSADYVELWNAARTSIRVQSPTEET